jgi:hypothetical protein
MNAMRKTRTRLQRVTRLLGREDGFADAIIVLPGVILIVLVALQIALYYVGSNVAQAAATASYSDARAYQSTPSAGHTAGNQVLKQTSGYLTSPSVEVDRAATTVTVTVTGHAVSLLPFLTLPEVKRTITGPIERWVPAP